MRIFEYIGASSLTSEATLTRLKTPTPGDVVLIGSKRAVVESVRDGKVCVGEGVCSAFLGLIDDRPYVQINGGPTRWWWPKDLEATCTLEWVEFWNWGDSTPGADKGVHFLIKRPLFRIAERAKSTHMPEYAPRTFAERVASAIASGDVAKGVPFEYELAGSSGARFFLLVSSAVSELDILHAKAHLAAQRDVVGPIQLIHETDS